MNFYLNAGLRALVCSIALALALNHLTTSLNPFLGLVSLLLILLLVGVYLFSLRRKGWRYLLVFLLSLVAFTSLFTQLDDRFFNHPRRYYAISATDQAK